MNCTWRWKKSEDTVKMLQLFSSFTDTSWISWENYLRTDSSGNLNVQILSVFFPFVCFFLHKKCTVVNLVKHHLWIHCLVLVCVCVARVCSCRQHPVEKQRETEPLCCFVWTPPSYLLPPQYFKWNGRITIESLFFLFRPLHFNSWRSLLHNTVTSISLHR